MSAQTCIVIGGRYGDVINILPCARDIAQKEGKCAVVVSEEFASVLDGCSYVEPVISGVHFTDIQPAIEKAREMFERVLVAKVNDKSVGISTQCKSFNQEAWRQIGYLDRWNDLPLVFDQRDKARETALIESVNLKRKPIRTSPVVLLNFSGKSSPFPYGDELIWYLPCNAQVVDLGKLKAHRLYDLLGLMDAADLLITGDTSTLHLAAASKVPVVNLIGDKPTLWHGSKPRNNSVLEIRYGEWNARRGELEELLKRL